MSRQGWSGISAAMARAAASAVLVTGSGAYAAGAGAAAPLQLACAVDRPVLHPGESIGIQAWVTDAAGRPIEPAPAVVWRTEGGRILGGENGNWTMPADSIVPGNVATYRAVAAVRQGADSVECELQVYVVAPRLPGDDRGPIGARGLLVGQAPAPKGYGLVSYLLLRRLAQTDEERRRHLSAIAAVLAGLSSVEDLLQIEQIQPAQLYVVLLPVERRVELPVKLTTANLARAAQAVLDVYNYARAEALLSTSKADGTGSGPYLAIRRPAAPTAAAPPPWDMSHVDQGLVRDWVNAYCALAAQPRNWTDVALTKLSLNTRNAIAVAARNLPDVLDNLDRWMPTGAER